MSDIYLAKTGVHKVLLIRFPPSFGQVPVLQPLLSCRGGGIEILPADKSSAANHLQMENFSNNCVRITVFTILDTQKYVKMGLSENSVPLNPMVLLIIIPIKWLFHWEY